MADHSAMKLGKRPAKRDVRVPSLLSLLSPEVPPAPAAHSWSRGRTDWGDLGNDKLGNCTAAGMFHLQEVAAMAAARKFDPSTKECIDFYYASTGQTPPSDNGGVELDVLTYAVKHGVLGWTIRGFATVNQNNPAHVMQGAYLFPGLYIGVELPISAQAQDVWDYNGNAFDPNNHPGGWGGHCVILVDYDETGVTFITWGALKKATWAWFDRYCDEAYAVLTSAWLNNEKSPAGFDVAALETYMGALA